MKHPPDIERHIRQHLHQHWSHDLAAEVTHEPTWWPRRYTLGRPTEAFLRDAYGELIDLLDEWRTWTARHRGGLVERNIRVDGRTYPVITHIIIPTLDTAADIIGGEWAARLQRARTYAALIDRRFPHRRNILDKTLAAVADWSRVDVELLLRAAAWFEQNPTSRFSPRQVPLEGFHTKWLESRRSVVARLAGLDDLGLLPPHPSRIHFTYLDPGHLSRGGRHHDSATVGDTFRPAYTPEILLISENKDTAIHFPHLPGAIAVEGAGSGAHAIASFAWIQNAPLIVYWGDMDSDGLRILDQFRSAGIYARSLFMDFPAYERWEMYGTDTDKHGNPISVDTRPAPHRLEQNERDLYELLNDAAGTRYRRVEQERIPLELARAEVLAMYTKAATP